MKALPEVEREKLRLKTIEERLPMRQKIDQLKARKQAIFAEIEVIVEESRKEVARIEETQLPSELQASRQAALKKEMTVRWHF